MIKRLLMCLSVISMSAYADIEVAWQGAFGFYANGTGPAPADPGDYLGTVFGNATVQLIWTPDNQISELDPFNVAEGYVSGGEIMLNSLAVNSTYGEYVAPAAVFADASYDTGVITLDQGYVYTRIFGSTAPIVGDYYFASQVVDPSFRTEPAGPPTFIEHNTGAVLGDELDRLIVPEPSVLAFLGLGGLLMAVRRRLK